MLADGAAPLSPAGLTQSYEAAILGGGFAAPLAAPLASSALAVPAQYDGLAADTAASALGAGRAVGRVAQPSTGLSAPAGASTDASATTSTQRLAAVIPATSAAQSDQPEFSKAALATTQPHQIDFTASNLPVFGFDASFSFSLPSFLYQSFSYGTGISFAGFGLHAGVSITGGVKGSVALSLGQFTPDYPVTIDPGVIPFVQDGQVFSIDPSLISTNDAKFSLSLPQANASLDFGLQASAGVTLSFPSIPIGVTLPFVGFVGYHLQIPSQSVGFKVGSIFKLPSNTTINIPGDGSVTLSELQAKVVTSDPQSAYEGLPTIELSGNTDPFFVANTDLVSILAQEVPDPFAVLQGSKSFAGGLAGISYKLLSLPLSGSLWLHEDVKLTPIGITETVTDTLTGQTQTGKLGDSFNFTAPASGNGVIPLSISYALEFSVQTTLQLDGAIKLTLEGPSVSASIVGISGGVGPLGNFNLLDMSGDLFDLYSNTSTQTLTTTDTVDVQNFGTSVTQTIAGKSGAVNITKPAVNVSVTATGTVSGGAFGIRTGTLSAAMATIDGLVTATGDGVDLQAGGEVNVDDGGRITGHGAAPVTGVLAMGNPIDAVINEGAITGFSQGVMLAGGSVKNGTGATIAATALGVSIGGANAQLVNNGAIKGATAVSLAQGGSVYNAQFGTIVGGAYGVYASGPGPLSVDNHCTLTGGTFGVHALDAATVTNLAGAYIHGGAVGVILDGGAVNEVVTNGLGGTISGGKVGVSLTGANTTLVDSGQISGSLSSVQLYGTQSNTLVLDPDAKLVGGVRMSSVYNTISLTAGSGDVGTIAGIGGPFAFEGKIDIASGAAWKIGGNLGDAILYGLNAADTLDDTAIAYAAGDRVVFDYYTHVLSVRAAGAPTVSVGTIQLAGPIFDAPSLSSDGSGGVEISFDAKKWSTVSADNGEVEISPTGLFAPDVTIAAGVTVSSDYYGVNAQKFGVYATQVRASLTNYGSILAENTAIYFASGGVVDNAAGAMISAGSGIRLGSNSADATDRVTFTNAGTVMAQESGVYIEAQGTVTNSGQITSATLNGVQLDAQGTVSNKGSISGGRSGARLFDGGFVYNEAGALVAGGRLFGVEITGAYGKVINCGSIYSAQGAGVNFGAGGLVINETGAITGATVGVTISGGAGTVANAAYIEGVQLAGGGQVINAATGTIGGGGIVDEGAGGVTITNHGAIDNDAGASVTFSAASDRLIVEAGSSWTGAVMGGGGTLELAGGTGTVTGLGGAASLSGAEAMNFSGFGAYSIDKGASWTLSGTNSLASGGALGVAGKLTLAGTLVNAGAISGAKGSTITLKKGDIIGGSLSSAGLVTVSGAGNTLDGTAKALTNGAAITLANRAALTIEGSIVNAGAITLAGTTGPTSLIVGKPGVTLSGGGHVVLGAGAFNTLTGAAATATLTNLDNTISGAGLIGAAKMTLVNKAAGIIDQTGSSALTIDTGTKAITNAGTIEASGPGGLNIASAVANTGLIEAMGGALTLIGPVTGTGRAIVDGGRLDFASAGAFTGGTTIESGILELGAASGAGGGAITFAPVAGAAATLTLDAAATPFNKGVANFANTLVNFGSGDFIDIAGMTYAAGATVTLTGQTLTVSSGGKTLNFTLAGTLPSLLLVVANDGGGVQINTEGISTQHELSAAVTAADQTAAGAGPVKLLICGNIDLTRALAPINLKTGVTLDIEGSGHTFSGPGAALTVTSGAVSLENLAFDGPLSLAAGASLSGYGDFGGAAANDGQIEAKGGVLTIEGPVTGAGTILIDQGASLVLGAAVGQTIDFAPGGGGALTLDAPGQLTGRIAGFAAGDTIDLAGLKATRVLRSGKTYSLYDGTQLVATLDIAWSGPAEVLHLASDGAGGTRITAAPSTHVGTSSAALFNQLAAGQASGAAASAASSGSSTTIASTPPPLARPPT